MKSPYAYIAIEGNIGAGKTTFAKWLAGHLDCDLMLEQFQENPFLEKFYDDPERFALSVELAFVSDRYRQLRERLGARNLFRQVLVSDYAFVKSMIFAKANLPADEFKLFRTMFKLMDAQVAQPEVVAILDPNPEKIRQQIETRGRSYEQDMPQDYLDKIAYHYQRHYRYARGSRILWIDSTDIDIVNRPADAKRLASLVLEPRKPGVYSLKA
ncbi:MAG: deoxynucleoside kinase [Crocinitomicaceae bacterium]|jgi:deoxyguanosine kinase|nr:deoxynucleoside kinase [Crocinitomicaceae bacterium]